MAEPKNADIVETTWNYTPEDCARSVYGFSDIQVFEGQEDTGPGVYHVGDVVNFVNAPGEVSNTEAVGKMWAAANLAQNINPSNLNLPNQLFLLGNTAVEMKSAYDAL